MAETDPFDDIRIEQRRHCVPHRSKHRTWACMKQQGLVIAHQKLIELQIEIRHERGNSE
jgi:hypothetical protein